MGGHGALNLASHFPDRAIGLISLAGWIKKEDYGDSNLFFRWKFYFFYRDGKVAIKVILNNLKKPQFRNGQLQKPMTFSI